MKGAKPSSGLVHLHKSFVELHFASKPLPQNVSVLACVDGKTLDTVLPGQVYATSCGQDHWLLGLQFVFKAYKEPVITHVDKSGDSQVTVAIATQGIQDKYNSGDPLQRAELQRSMEAAALKFAQTAVMRKEGRLQISGPNINIPKKQLRSQWPAVLEKLAPQDVTAHIFVDSQDSYIACAAKIILTKAKAEPVFYLSGLSQLLKSFMGAFVSMDLLPEQQVVRLNIDTGKGRPASMSTTAAAAAATQAEQAETSSAAAPQAGGGVEAADVQQLCGASSASQAGDTAERRGSAAAAAAASPLKGRLGLGGATAAGAERAPGRPRPCGHRPGAAAGAPAAAAEAGGTAAASGQSSRAPLGFMQAANIQQQQQYMLEGMASSTAAASALNRSDSTPAAQARAQQAGVAAENSECSSLRPSPGTPGRSTGHAPSPNLADPAAAAAAGVGEGVARSRTPAVGSDPAAAAPSPGPAVSAGVTAGSDAGLWLLADHAAQLKAVGSSGSLPMAEAAATVVAEQQQSELQRQHSASSRGAHARPAASGRRRSRRQAQGAAAAAGAAAMLASVRPAFEHVAVGGLDPVAATAAAAAALDASVHPAALPCELEGPYGAGSMVAAPGGSYSPFAAGSDAACVAAASAVYMARPPYAPAAGGGVESGMQLAQLAEHTAAVRSSDEAEPCLNGSTDATTAAHLDRNGYLEGWQVHPKRRRTLAQASSGLGVQRQQQHDSSMQPAPQLEAVGVRPSMLGSTAVTADEFACWDAAATAAAHASSLYLQRQQQQQHYLQQQQLAAQHAAALQRQHGSQPCMTSGGAWPLGLHGYGQQQQPGSVAGAEPSAADLLAAAAAAASGRSDDLMALAQQQEEQDGIGGAVAVVTRVGGAGLGTGKQQDLRQQWKLGAQQQAPVYLRAPAAAWHTAASLNGGVGSGAWPEHDTTAAVLAAAAAAGAPLPAAPGSSGLQPLKGTVLVSPAEWSPALQHIGSPTSNTSSISRMALGHGSAPNSAPSSAAGSVSPGFVAAQQAGAGGPAAVAAVAAAAGKGAPGSVVTGASAGAGLTAAGLHLGPSLAAHSTQQQQQQQPGDMPVPAVMGTAAVASALQGSSTAAFSGAGGGANNLVLAAAVTPAAGAMGSPALSAGSGGMQQQQQQLLLKAEPAPPAASSTPAGTPTGTAAAAGTGCGVMLSQAPQEQATQPAGSSAAAAATEGTGRPVLPDADNLLVVGKALVQVMNLLGAGSEARLALTRALRGLSPHDREWLLSITYPHLQDSCRRRALPEMRMILNEVAGMDCFASADAAEAAAAAAGGGLPAAPAGKAMDA